MFMNESPEKKATLKDALFPHAIIIAIVSAGISMIMAFYCIAGAERVDEMEVKILLERLERQEQDLRLMHAVRYLQAQLRGQVKLDDSNLIQQ